MLARQPASTVVFTRRDIARLAVAAAILIAALTAILASDVASNGLGLGVGEIPSSNITAPRALTYDSALETQLARQQASEGVAPQYDYTAERAAAIATAQGQAFATLVAPADAAFNDPSIPFLGRTAVLEGLFTNLSTQAHSTFVQLTPARWKAVRNEAARVLDEVERTELRDTDVATTRQSLGGRMQGLNANETDLAVELITPLVTPNSSYSDLLTQQKRDAAAAGVAPVTVSVLQGQVVVDAGHPITPLNLEEITALGLNQSHLDLARLAGWLLLSGLLVGLLLAWVWRFRPELWHRNNVLLMVGLMLVVTTLGMKLIAGRSILPFFLPTAALGMLVTVLLDAEAATVLMAVVAVIAGAVNGNSLEIASYVFLGGFAGIVTVRRGDSLQVFLRSGVAVALVSVVVVSTFALLGERDVTGVLQLWAASAASAAGATVIAVGSFAALGNVFGILTVFHLLELANPSQPVLRRLLVETPGTYHHSLMVGNLAERAAEAIGADPLQARIAAYYHDIGKLNNPLAFIENQSGENIHDELPPEVSAQILKAHVADGIDVAYRARLPKPLIAFIPQHHGTALMSYFYAKAREEAAARYGGMQTTEGALAAEGVDARRFRHAGPKPQTREAAILMLADSVEASVRSLSSRDEPTIRAMVARIIDERLKDGQFDECDLTLRDVERIREAFISQLLGMYHQRIAYPQNKVVELESRRNAGSGT